jgi:hypothetical protein
MEDSSMHVLEEKQVVVTTPNSTGSLANPLLQSTLIRSFLPAATPIHWGSNHPDYDQEKDKRARWSEEELQYLSDTITSLASTDTSNRYQ